jgi:hypothetical protein
MGLRTVGYGLARVGAYIELRPFLKGERWEVFLTDLESEEGERWELGCRASEAMRMVRI